MVAVSVGDTAVFRVHADQGDLLVVSCGTCDGWVVQLWGYEPVQLLPWKVIEHWLSEHWDGARDETLLDSEDSS
jgi:hypothetical protein